MSGRAMSEDSGEESHREFACHEANTAAKKPKALNRQVPARFDLD
jgi:hypothetical protein